MSRIGARSYLAERRSPPRASESGRPGVKASGADDDAASPNRLNRCCRLCRVGSTTSNGEELATN
jgi:hypothetical protein